MLHPQSSVSKTESRSHPTSDSHQHASGQLQHSGARRTRLTERNNTSTHHSHHLTNVAANAEGSTRPYRNSRELQCLTRVLRGEVRSCFRTSGSLRRCRPEWSLFSQAGVDVFCQRDGVILSVVVLVVEPQQVTTLAMRAVRGPYVVSVC